MTFPWQFQPESYGALGNGKIVGDGAITSGTASFSSASYTFTSADIGKTIVINGASGATSAPLITTITSVSGGAAQLAASATANVTNGAAAWGTDDTAAIRSCFAAAGTYATSHDYLAQVLFSDKIYCLATAPQSGTSPDYLTQLPIPVPALNGNSPKLIFSMQGPSNGSAPQYFGASTTWPNVSGAVLLSMVSPSATGSPSVVGGPVDATGLTGGFANVMPVIDGITVCTPWNNQQIGFDLRFCANAIVQSASYQVLAAVSGNAPALTAIPSGGNSIGLYMPLKSNNDKSYVQSFTAECVSFGIAFSEHFTADDLTIVYANVGMFVNIPSAAIHGGAITYASVEASNIALQSGAGAGGQFPINIGLLDCEAINTRDIDDSVNSFTGIVQWAAFDQTAPRVNGGSLLKVVNNRLGPGHMASPPAVPLTTVAVPAASLPYRDATVVVHTGAGVTVSAITVDGTATSQTVAAASSSVPVRVPNPRSIALTYAGGTPTWDWWLD